MRLFVRTLCFSICAASIQGGEESERSFQTDFAYEGSAKESFSKDVLNDSFPSSKWRWGVGFAPLLGTDAKFSGLGGFSNPLNPQPLGGGQNYNYDNGFVNVDSSGNAGNLTSNWGYTENSQFDAVGDSLAYSISGSSATGSVKDSDDFSLGLEILGYFEVGELPGLSLTEKKSRWGFKATLHYANISIENSSVLSADVTQVTDAFALGGVVPPLAPYSGPFNGPGPLIDDRPSRSTSTFANGASISGNRELDVDLFGLTVGPYLELPLTEKFSINAEAGFSLALVNGDYSFNSSTTIPGSGAQTGFGSGSETSLLPGFSVGFNAIYELTDSWSAYGGGRYQYYSTFEVDAGNSRAELDFGGTFVTSLGVLYRF